MKQSLVITLVIAILVLSSIVVALSPPAEPFKRCYDICEWQRGNCEFNTQDQLAKRECERSYEECIRDKDKCHEFKINLGKSQTIDGLTFNFREVIEDSRCPPDVNCVWQGRVVVRIGITGANCQNQQPLYLDVSTEKLQEFQYARKDQYKNVYYSLTLAKVEPEYKSTVKEPYTVHLMLQKDTSGAWCDLAPCPPVVSCEQMKQPQACTADAKICPDGTAVGRDPYNNCEFKKCPSEVPACFKDARVCPDGTTQVRDPHNNCEFPACPTSLACSREVQICPDGKTSVSRNPEKNCEFNICPGQPIEGCERGCYSLTQNSCFPYGVRILERNVPAYCDISGDLQQQKLDGSQASNSYECLSNFQSDGKCVSVSENLNILQKIIKWFSKIFGGR